MTTFDIAIVGGGIVGLATALALSEQRPGSIVVLEAESDIATHQTGHNSGVIHWGSTISRVRSRHHSASRGASDVLCEQQGIVYDRCGKLAVATTEDELPRLDALAERGVAKRAAGAQAQRSMN